MRDDDLDERRPIVAHLSGEGRRARYELRAGSPLAKAVAQMTEPKVGDRLLSGGSWYRIEWLA